MQKFKLWCRFCKKTFYRPFRGGKFCSPECYFDYHTPIRDAGCWIWQGVKTRAGYGIMRHGRKNVIHPHRFSYERFIGPIPVGLFGLHTCDNPSCVNPEHIFAGTIKDNTDDMLRKGRNATDYNNGEDNAAAKLTNKAITQIFTSKKSAHFLAAKFGVYRTCIYKIWTRKTWAHVTKNLKRP